MEQTNDADQYARSAASWGSFTALAVALGAYIASSACVAIFAGVMKLAQPQWLGEQPAVADLMLTATSAVGIIGFVGLYLYGSQRSFKDLGFRKPKASDGGWLLVAAVAYFMLLVTVMSVLALFPGFDIDQQQNVGYNGVQGMGLLYAFVGLVALPPLAEEMLFRGFLYRGLATQWPRVAAALVTSVLFGLVHMQWNVAIDTFLLSLVLIGLYEKTQNLWVCVALHAMKNGVAFYVLFVSGA